MYVLAEEQKTNSSLVFDFKASAELTYNDDDASTLGSVAAAIPATNLKLQRILKDLTLK